MVSSERIVANSGPAGLKKSSANTRFAAKE